MGITQNVIEIVLAVAIAFLLLTHFDFPGVSQDQDTVSVPEIDMAAFFASPPPHSASAFDTSSEINTKSRAFHMVQNCNGTLKAGGLVNVTSFNPATQQLEWHWVNSSTACDTSTPNQAVVIGGNAYPFASANLYHVTTTLDCTMGPAKALSTLAFHFGIPSGQLLYSSSECGSFRLIFACASSTSVEDADQLCARLTNAACQPGTNLFAAVAGTECGVEREEHGGNSNKSLYALFALTAIPLLLMVCCACCYRRRQSEARARYLQGAARDVDDLMFPTKPSGSTAMRPVLMDGFYTPSNTPSLAGAGHYPPMVQPRPLYDVV